MPGKVWEVYHPRMGIVDIIETNPYAAVETMADRFNKKYDLKILRGHKPFFGVRRQGSEIFEWFQVGGHAIPVYKLERVAEHTIEPYYLSIYSAPIQVIQ